MSTYTCAACRQTFEYEEGWTDADAKAEADAKFGPDAEADEVVCDDCYKAMLAREKKATEPIETWPRWW